MDRHHDEHHRLIAERVERFGSFTMSVHDRVARREAYKRAFGTVRGHLSSHHPGCSIPTSATLDELLNLHEREHSPEGW